MSRTIGFYDHLNDRESDTNSGVRIAVKTECGSGTVCVDIPSVVAAVLSSNYGLHRFLSAVVYKRLEEGADDDPDRQAIGFSPDPLAEGIKKLLELGHH